MVDAINQDLARDHSTFLEIENLFMLLSSVCNRELKSTGEIRSKSAEPGMTIPSLYSNLSIRMHGQIGSVEDLDYHNMMYYYWIILVWINGEIICIVIIFYLLVNEIGFAHPKLINSEQLKMLKEDDANNKFTIIDRAGMVADGMQTCYRGYLRSILKLISDLLVSEQCFHQDTSVKAIDVLILLIDAVVKGMNRNHNIESVYLEAVLKIRRLQLAITSCGAKVEKAKEYLVGMMLQVMSYTSQPFVRLDQQLPSEVSLGELLHSALKAFQTDDSDLLAYGERGTIVRAIRDQLFLQPQYHFEFATQVSCSSSENIMQSTGLYDESGVDVDYTVTDLNNLNADYQDAFNFLPLPVLEKGQLGVAVFKKFNSSIVHLGYILYHVEGDISEVDGIKINDKELGNVCQLKSGICEFCTCAMDYVVLRNECCHSNHAVNHNASKCICISKELMDQIQIHNATHGDILITVKEKVKEKVKRVSSQMTSSSWDNSSDVSCYCNSSWVDGVDEGIECSDEDCPFNRWFHYNCIKTETISASADWYCSFCSKRNKAKVAVAQVGEPSTTVEMGLVKMEEGEE